VLIGQLRAWSAESEEFATRQQVGLVLSVLWPMVLYVALIFAIGIHHNNSMTRKMSRHIRNAQGDRLLVPDITGEVQNQILLSGTKQGNRWFVETSVVDPAKAKTAEIVGCRAFLNAGQQQMTGFPVVEYRNHDKRGFVGMGSRNRQIVCKTARLQHRAKTSKK
jgi:hypothetical protein